MKKITTTILLTATILLNCTGCNTNEAYNTLEEFDSIFSSGFTLNSATQQLEKDLEEKYGKDYTIVASGGRSAGQNKIEGIAYSNDENLRFNVWYDDDGEVQSGEEKKIFSRILSDYVEEKFAEYGYEAMCASSGRTYREEIKAIEDYVEYFNEDIISFYVIVKSDDPIEIAEIEKIYLEISHKTGRKIGSTFIRLSEKDFNIVEEEARLTPDGYYADIDLKLWGATEVETYILQLFETKKITSTKSDLSSGVI